MQRYVFSRAIQSLICLLIVTFIVFFLTRLTGDPSSILLPLEATQEQRNEFIVENGLDKSPLIQYGVFLGKMLRGDFGESFRARRPALDMVLARVPATFELGIVAILISIVLGCAIGVYSAVNSGRFFDLIGKTIAVFGQSVPNFWLGLVLVYVFAVWLHILPTGGREGVLSFILPSVTLAWYVAAGIMRLTRSSMLEVLGAGYITLARAKGLSNRVVIWKHALKNAMPPVLTFAAILFIMMLGGAIVVETVFSWPGIGRLLMESVTLRDFPVVQVIVLLFSAMYIMGNFIVDILYAYLNPKIRYK